MKKNLQNVFFFVFTQILSRFANFLRRFANYMVFLVRSCVFGHNSRASRLAARMDENDQVENIESYKCTQI